MFCSRIITILAILELLTIAVSQHLAPRSDPRSPGPSNPKVNTEDVPIPKDVEKRLPPGQYAGHTCHGSCAKNPNSPHNKAQSSTPFNVEVGDIIDTKEEREYFNIISDETTSKLLLSHKCTQNPKIQGAWNCPQRRSPVVETTEEYAYSHQSNSRAAGRREFRWALVGVLLFAVLFLQIMGWWKGIGVGLTSRYFRESRECVLSFWGSG